MLGGMVTLILKFKFTIRPQIATNQTSDICLSFDCINICLLLYDWVDVLKDKDEQLKRTKHIFLAWESFC